METKELICICCPLGCRLTARLQEGKVESVTGNTCPRGDEYARKELSNPTRIVTTTVRMKGGGMLPVKTASDIPKGKVMDCVRQLKEVEAKRPVHVGQVILEDAAGTGVPVVATKGIL